MSFYDTKSGLWSETNPQAAPNMNKLQSQFPNTTIVLRSDGVIEVQKVVSAAEKLTFTTS